MVFKDDMVFLIEEYTMKFGTTPHALNGPTFPPRQDWERIVRAIRRALDSGQPMDETVELSEAA